MTEIEIESKKKMNDLNKYDSLLRILTEHYRIARLSNDNNEQKNVVEDMISLQGKILNIKTWFNSNNIGIVYIHNPGRRYYYRGYSNAV